MLIKSADDKSKRLAPLVLAKAFRGELVPQDPSVEPAAMLLQRFTKGRAVPAKKVPTSRISKD